MNKIYLKLDKLIKCEHIFWNQIHMLFCQRNFNILTREFIQKGFKWRQIKLFLHFFCLNNIYWLRSSDLKATLSNQKKSWGCSPEKSVCLTCARLLTAFPSTTHKKNTNRQKHACWIQISSRSSNVPREYCFTTRNCPKEKLKDCVYKGFRNVQKCLRWKKKKK